jgi:hypothetical protein
MFPMSGLVQRMCTILHIPAWLLCQCPIAGIILQATQFAALSIQGGRLRDGRPLWLGKCNFTWQEKRPLKPNDFDPSSFVILDPT